MIIVIKLWKKDKMNEKTWTPMGITSTKPTISVTKTSTTTITVTMIMIIILALPAWKVIMKAVNTGN